MKQYVSIADVIDWVSEDDYQTSQPCESLQLRGELPCRSGGEPAYTVRTGLPSAIVPNGEPMGEVQYIGDVEFERLDERDIATLQTFPEWFTVTPNTKTDTRRLIGNAVPPQLAESVMQSV